MPPNVRLQPAYGMGTALAASIVLHAAILAALCVVLRHERDTSPHGPGYLYVTLAPAAGGGTATSQSEGPKVALSAPRKLVHLHRLTKKLTLQLSKRANSTRTPPPTSALYFAGAPNLWASARQTTVAGAKGGLSGSQAASASGLESGDSPLPGDQMDEPPAVISTVVPDYPEAARRRRIEGEVVLRFVVDRQGNVENSIKVVESIPMLDQAAIGALRKWRFSPGRERGMAVRVLLEVPLRFTLRSDD